MNNQHKYTTSQKERKVFALFMIILLLTVVAWGIMELCGVFDPPAWEPDTSFPMANASISWDQTFHAGAWEVN